MESIFALFGSKSAFYLEALTGYCRSRNKHLNSKGYKSYKASDFDVFIGNVKTGSLASQHDNPIPGAHVAMGNLHLDCAPNSCTAALKDRDLSALIDESFSTTISSLKGNFLLIGWDQQGSALRFSASAFNPRSLFYAYLDQCFIVTSDLALLEHLVTPEVDPTAILQWLAGRPDPNRSMFSNILQLPFAHTGCLTADKPLSVQRFWDIDHTRKLILADEYEYQQHFYDLLLQAVKDELPLSNQAEGLGPIFSQMSGGMDSTSITALLNTLTGGDYGADQRGSFDLHSISHTYRQTESCDEIDKIEQMREFLALQNSHFVELDQFSDLSFAQLYPTQLQSPGMVASPKYQQEAELIQQLAGRHLFTGNGGDEMCWGHSLAYRDRLASGELGVIKEVYNSAAQLGMSPITVMMQVLVKPMLPASLLTLLGKLPVDAEYFPAWLGSQQQDRLKAVAKHNPFAGSNQLAKRARYEGLFHTSTFNSMRSYQQVCDPLNIAVHHPFFNKQIAEFSFAIPQKLHIRGQYPKYLLRKTMDTHLPKSVCWDQTKTVFDQHFANLVRANKNELRTLLAHPGLQDLGLVDNQTLLAGFDNVVNSPNGSLNVDLLYAILTQSWYQTHILKDVK